jgi:G3E family GTPase
VWSGEHDDDVTSFVYRNTRPFDRDKLEDFLSAAVALYGASMLRYKGVLHIAGVEQRTVFQGVHMIFGSDLGRRWMASETPEMKIVFIGKRLPVEVFRAGLDNCVFAS